MKKKNKIIIGIIIVILSLIALYVFYIKHEESIYSENIKNLYINNGNNEIIEIPSQIDE